MRYLIILRICGYAISLTSLVFSIFTLMRPLVYDLNMFLKQKKNIKHLFIRLEN